MGWQFPKSSVNGIMQTKSTGFCTQQACGSHSEWNPVFALSIGCLKLLANTETLRTYRPDVAWPAQICRVCESSLKSSPRLLFFIFPTSYFEECSPFRRTFPDYPSLELFSLFLNFSTHPNTPSLSALHSYIHALCGYVTFESDRLNPNLCPTWIPFDLCDPRWIT